MSTFTFRKPRLPSHYYVLCDPPDEKGDEVLQFVSETRRIKLKGHSFREFRNAVIPLLDGDHTVDEIIAAVAGEFAAPDIEAALALLAEQNLLQEGDGRTHGGPSDPLEPQLNLFHNLGVQPPEVQARLSAATVAVVGLGGAGSAAAAAIAAAGIAGLRLIDSAPICAADRYLAPWYALADADGGRAAALDRNIALVAPETTRSVHAAPLDSDDDVRNAVDGADFVICCLDAGQSSQIYKLNRVCLAAGIPWIATASAGAEVTVGPLVKPFETACYLCYTMRLVACAENPEDAFAFQNFLDRRKRDDSPSREGLCFGAALAGNLAGLEAVKLLSGVLAPATVGRIVVFDLLDLSTTFHQVLRKPWCPACDRGYTAPGSSRLD